MKTAHLESAFETEIVAHLVAHGWTEGDRTAYQRTLGLDTGEMLTFFGVTQPETWDQPDCDEASAVWLRPMSWR